MLSMGARIQATSNKNCTKASETNQSDNSSQSLAAASSFSISFWNIVGNMFISLM
jgi:hypothetical protein